MTFVTNISIIYFLVYSVLAVGICEKINPLNIRSI